MLSPQLQYLEVLLLLHGWYKPLNAVAHTVCSRVSSIVRRNLFSVQGGEWEYQGKLPVEDVTRPELADSNLLIRFPQRESFRLQLPDIVFCDFFSLFFQKQRREFIC